LFYVTPPRSAHGLRDRLARDRELPIGDAITIAFGIAEALAVAHRSGVRHGDLRPKHIDLTPTGPVVASLGVIDAIMPDRDVGDGSTIVTFGSPTYLSPEQLANGRPGDSRSDVYALGCILYEMLAGEPPFGRASRSMGLAPKLTQAPALVRTRRESVPEALERIIHTCLARVPADRYASGEHLARALAELSPTASLRAP
jgi:serine/threonine-protein kinase